MCGDIQCKNVRVVPPQVLDLDQVVKGVGQTRLRQILEQDPVVKLRRKDAVAV